MFKLILVFLLWLIAIWFSLDSYMYSKKLSQVIINMFHLIRIGICENRMSIEEIVKEESFFSENGATDFSMFLWENHELLGLDCELIDSYNAFCHDSKTASGQACDEGIIAIEKDFNLALSSSQTELRAKFVTFVTLSTSAFAVAAILLV